MTDEKHKQEILAELKEYFPLSTHITINDEGTATLHFSDGRQKQTWEIFANRIRELMYKYEELSMDFNIPGKPLVELDLGENNGRSD